MFNNNHVAQAQQDNRQLRRKIEYMKFLKEVEGFLSGVKKPKCFISYAWEDGAVASAKKTDDRLHTRLERLKNDLVSLGAEVFLDIYNMHGDMKAQMQDNIAQSDVIFLIGTPRLMTRLKDPTTNVSFEWGHIKAKLQDSPNCLAPLLFEGDFATAFPAEVSKDILIRDMRQPDAHEIILAGLANPMGIITDIFDLHKRSQDDAVAKQYRLCWERLEASLKLIDAEPAQAKPEIDPTLLINFNEIELGRVLKNKPGEELCLGQWKGHGVTVKRVNISQDKVKQEFIREVKIMGRLRHPNIHTLYGVCIDSGHESLIMEYLPKGTLALRLSSAAIPQTLQHKIALDIGRGLLYLHEHQNHILHQDLTSENILLSDQFDAKLTGFGFAQAHTKSIANAAKGATSIAWTAPEIIRCETYTAKADVYSFGVILWEILTGKVPTSPLNFDNVPMQYKNLIRACLAEQPQRRPNVQEIITQLEAIPAVNVNEYTTNVLLASLPMHNDADKKAEALFALAKTHEKTNNHQESFKLYSEAADLGFAKAEANVGAYLLQGIGGIAVDKTKAHRYLQSAANKGEPKAQYNLARTFEKGDGVAQDLQQAKYWYTHAANQTIDTKTADQARVKLQAFSNNMKFTI